MNTALAVPESVSCGDTRMNGYWVCVMDPHGDGDRHYYQHLQ